MPLYRVLLDKPQLEDILAVLRKAPSRTFSVDKLLTLLQALTIVGAACWTVFQYVTFQHRSNEFELRRLEIAKERAHVDLDIATLDATLKGIQVHNETRNSALAEQSGYSVTSDMAVHALPDSNRRSMKRYRVDYTIELKPTSSSRLEVSGVIFDWFVATLKADSAAPRVASVDNVGVPASRWNRSGLRPGSAKWERVGGYACVAAEPQAELASPWDRVFQAVHATAGCAMTGIWAQNEVGRASENFIVTAPEGSLFGVTAALCINGCAQQYDLYSDWDKVMLDNPVAQK
jgi:hypothetical protein